MSDQLIILSLVHYTYVYLSITTYIYLGNLDLVYKYTNTRAIMYGVNVRYKCMQVLTYIQVLFNATTTTKYAI